MRFGLIGLGAAGRAHLEVLARLDEVELVGIADLNPGPVAELGERYGIALATTDPAEVIESPEVEVVAVIAGDKAHHPLVLAAAEAGKHVVCEKPIATEVAAAREMVAAMRAAGKLFCISFNNRAGRVPQRIRELVRDGFVGHLRMVRQIGLMAQPDHRGLRELMGEPAAHARARNIIGDGKNALFDCGVHSFDYARHLVGSEFRRIEAYGWSMRGFAQPDHGVAVCEHENGVCSLIEKSFVYAYEAEKRKEYVRYDVLGDEGSLSWDLDTGMLRGRARHATVDEDLGHGGKDAVRQKIYRGLIASVGRGELLDWLATGEDGLKATEAAQAAAESMAANGVMVRDVGGAANWFDDRADLGPDPRR